MITGLPTSPTYTKVFEKTIGQAAVMSCLLLASGERTLVTSLFGDELHSFVVFGDPFFGVFFGVGSGDGTAVFRQFMAFRRVDVLPQSTL